MVVGHCGQAGPLVLKPVDILENDQNLDIAQIQLLSWMAPIALEVITLKKLAIMEKSVQYW